jgi:hypothetical protein
LVCAKEKFKSNFLSDFIDGEIDFEPVVSEKPILYLFNNIDDGGDAGGGGVGIDNYRPLQTPCEFSETAKLVFKTGLNLWKYYHAQSNCNVNASLYDIREHFQGRNNKGTMNSTSNNKKYNELIGNLRLALKLLAKKIEPKIYRYGFLMN